MSEATTAEKKYTVCGALSLQRLSAASQFLFESIGTSRCISVAIMFMLLLPAIGVSQNCNCPAYDATTSEVNLEIALLKKNVVQLQSSPNAMCKAKSFEWLAEFFLDEMQLDSAELYFNLAERAFTQTGCSDSVFMLNYKYHAQLFYTRSEFAKAQEYAFKLLKVAESANDTFQLAICNTMIAQLFNQTEQAEKGIIYTRKATLLTDGIHQPRQKTTVLATISRRYLWHYQDTKKTTSLDTAELYARRLLDYSRSQNSNKQIANAYNILQGVAYERGDLKGAIVLLDSSSQYTDPTDIDMLAVNFFDQADILLELKNYPEALRMADSCLYYRKLEENPVFTADCYAIMARIHLESGNYKSAYEYNELADAITDSLRDVEKTKEVTELERKYSQAKNEKTISDLNQAQEISKLNIQLLTAGIAGALLVILLIVVFYRQSVLKNKHARLETEQRLNRARMNPHFFFNTLSSLQTSALKDKDPAKLADLLSMYSKIMRRTLESTYEDLVSVETEVEYLQMYLRLQQFRNNGNFTYSVDVADNLDSSEVQIPAMIIQPFVENAIEHGFNGIDRQGQVGIHFEKRNETLVVTIIDNGAGITKSSTAKTHKSRATEITRDRLFLLNIKHKAQASFEIKNNPGNSGTTVVITLPILY